MESLEERLERRKEEYHEIVRSEKELQKVVDKVLPHIPELIKVNYSVYPNYSFLYIYTASMEQVEEEVIPQLSQFLGIKWTKEIDESVISYRTTIRNISPYYVVYLHLFINEENSGCQIFSVKTGRTKKVAKLVEIEEPEIEYFINCEDE